MNELEFKNIYNNDLRLVENNLTSYLPSAISGQAVVVDAMKYSLLNGGKRLRPILVLEFCNACGAERHNSIDFACAIEYIHTYSLIHDDLPAMDNDDLRRGKPSCHKQFDEATALLAGDALLTHAFSIISDSEIEPTAKISAISLLAQNSGVAGMIGGQVLDLMYESQNPSSKELVTVHKLKTGALISAACILGCLAAGATEQQISAASEFAYNLGIAFQIKDDILDINGSSEKLGKNVGSDSANNKVTYATKVGIQKAQKDVELLTQKAISCLDAFENNDFIVTLANYLTNRDH